MSDKETIAKDGKILVQDTVIRATYAKTEMCKMEGITDCPPLMLIAVESDETNPDHEACVEFQNENGLAKPYHTALIPLVHKEDVVDCIEDIVKNMPKAPFAFMLICAEGYIKSVDKGSEVQIGKGDLQKDFTENVFTDVQEAVIVTAIDYEGTTLMSMVCPYKYDDFGVPMFDSVGQGEITTIDEPDRIGEMGRIPDVLLNSVRFMQMAVIAEAMNELMSKARKKDEGR